MRITSKKFSMNSLQVSLSDLKDQQIGEWKIETFKISNSGAELHNLRERLNGSFRFVLPGIYKRLMRGETLVMSNTHAEIADCIPALTLISDIEARSILVAGLGLGVFLKLVQKFEFVKLVDVVEISDEVLRMVAPSFKPDKRFRFYNCDIFEFEPEHEEYSFAWFDIWESKCDDNIPEAQKLFRKFSDNCEVMMEWNRGLVFCNSTFQYSAWCLNTCVNLSKEVD